MPDREKVIADIEEQIAWIRDNDFHKFPGWDHAVLAMKDALSLLKEQEAMKECLKKKCVICPHCANCDVDENGLLKEQQPKTARWEKRTGMMPPEYHGHYWCSNCEWHGKYNEREKDYKFCPACGAKMENPTST